MSDRGQNWRAVAAVFAFNGALFGAWAARVPTVAHSHGLDHGAIGLALLFLAGGALVAFPLTGQWVDRAGSARVTRALIPLYPLCFALLAFAPSPTWLATALFAFGAVHGAMDIAMNAWAAEVERHHRHPMMSSFHAMFSLGAGLGAFSGFLASVIEMGLASHFVLFAGLTTAFTWIWAFTPWQSEPAAHPSGQVFALPSRSLVLVGLFAACASLGEGAMADWSAVYLRDVGQADETIAALGYAVFSVAMVTIRLLGDGLTRRFGPVNVARIAMTSAALGAAATVLWPQPVPILIGLAFLGFGYALAIPLAFSRAANDPDMPAGRALASVATFGYGALLIGPPLIGGLATLTSLRGAFSLLVILALLALALSAKLRRPTQT